MERFIMVVAAVAVKLSATLVNTVVAASLEAYPLRSAEQVLAE
jgi:hypothetical protein